MVSDFPEGVRVFPFTKVIGLKNIEFGSPVLMDDFVFIDASSGKGQIGSHVHIASFSSITGGGEFALDDFCGLASGVRIVTGSDDFKGNGFGNPTVPDRFRNVKRGIVSLNRFSIIGANTVILPGVTVGEGASVAAGSIVSKDLTPWGTYIGNRRVGERDREGVLASHSHFLEQRDFES
jgi:acetyltransferase-like isoleucine patch superfamily enzyme